MVRALTVADYGWANHPAALMWKGYEEALGRYGFVCCEVWLELGFGDTCAATIATDLAAAGVTTVRAQAELADGGALPPWLGDADLHRSHRSALVRKDPDFYRPQFPDAPDDLPYVWPVRSPPWSRPNGAGRRTPYDASSAPPSACRRRPNVLAVGAAGPPRRDGRRGAGRSLLVGTRCSRQPPIGLRLVPQWGFYGRRSVRHLTGGDFARSTHAHAPTV